MDVKDVKAAKLTADLSLSGSAITEWKKGKGKPSAEAIIKIADYFGVSTDWLLTGVEPNPPELIIPDILKDVRVAFHDGDSDFTQDEVDKIADFVKFVKSQRR